MGATEDADKRKKGHSFDEAAGVWVKLKEERPAGVTLDELVEDLRRADTLAKAAIVRFDTDALPKEDSKSGIAPKTKLGNKEMSICGRLLVEAIKDRCESGTRGFSRDIYPLAIMPDDSMEPKKYLAPIREWEKDPWTCPLLMFFELSSTADTVDMAVAFLLPASGVR